MEYPNWFNKTAKHNFEVYLSEFADKPNLNFLQLGAFTGDASVWMAENILTRAGSILMDVDTWKGSDESAHDSMDFDDVFATYIDKVKHYQRILWKQSDTFSYLTKRNYIKEYDFIYIDADHTTVGVLLDAELSWPLLKSGGIMAFDDYTWGPDMPPELTPALGINLFLERHKQEFEMLAVNAQVWIKKI